MNKIAVKFFSLAVAVALIAGCISNNPVQKLDSFVDNAELKSDSYNAQQWANSMKQFEKLVEDYNAPGKTYSEAEKQMAARAMGRYHSLLIKNGVKATASYLEEMESILPSYLEGLVDGLGENSEEIEKSLENLFDSEELEKAFKDLGNSLEEIGLIETIIILDAIVAYLQVERNPYETGITIKFIRQLATAVRYYTIRHQIIYGTT